MPVTIPSVGDTDMNETDKTPASMDCKASRSYCMPICKALISKKLR